MSGTEAALPGGCREGARSEPPPAPASFLEAALLCAPPPVAQVLKSQVFVLIQSKLGFKWGKWQRVTVHHYFLSPVFHEFICTHSLRTRYGRALGEVPDRKNEQGWVSA